MNNNCSHNKLTTCEPTPKKSIDLIKNELYTQMLNPQKNITIIDNKDIFKFQGQILKRQANLH